MKHKIILIILLITLIFGCKTPTEEQTGITLNPELSLIDELTVDVLKINSFEFYYDISDLNEKRYYHMFGSDIKVTFPTVKYLEDGTPYDTVYMERKNEIAYAYCSKKHCKEKDLYAEPINFSLYYIDTPREKITTLTGAEIIGEELYNNRHNTKLINFTNSDKDQGLMWVQSYYTVPLKLEYTDKDGNEKKIIYENITWDTVREYDLQIPFNVTLINYYGKNKIVFGRLSKPYLTQTVS